MSLTGKINAYLFNGIMGVELLVKKAAVEALALVKEIDYNLHPVIREVANGCEDVADSVSELTGNILEVGSDVARGLYEIVEDVGVELAKHGGYVPFKTITFEGLELTFYSTRVEIRNILTRQIKKIKARHDFGRVIQVGRFRVSFDRGFLEQGGSKICPCEKRDLMGTVMLAKKFTIEVDGKKLEVDLQKVIPAWHYLMWDYFHV